MQEHTPSQSHDLINLLAAETHPSAEHPDHVPDMPDRGAYGYRLEALRRAIRNLRHIKQAYEPDGWY